MIEITDKNSRYDYYTLAYNNNDALTGMPLTIADGTIIENMCTGSVAINVDTKVGLMYDRESNSWK